MILIQASRQEGTPKPKTLPDIPPLFTQPTGKDESNNDFEVVEIEVEEDIHRTSKQNIPSHFQQEKS